MSILGAMFSAVSGLQANSDALSVISDNIANANTVGYKDATTDFSSLVSQSSNNAANSAGGGVLASASYNIAQQGTLQAASSPTDLAISGNGFFVVSNQAAGGNTSYTRAGAFTADSQGYLQNASGFYLEGEPLTAAQSAAITAGQTPSLSASTLASLQPVNVSNISGTASATANVSLDANLPADDSSTAETMTVPVYDPEGVEHDMTMTFTPNGTANQWTVSAAFANGGSTTTTMNGGDTVAFNSNGTLDTSATTFNGLTINWGSTVSGDTSPQSVNFNLGTNDGSNGLTQLGSSYSVTSINQDGVQFGTYTGATVDQNGVVTANFSNGLTRAIALVPIATFADPDGLSAASGDVYTATAASGSAILQQAGTGAAGTVSPSSLENSTVDIATEFSNMIIAQNAYQADSKVLTTADQMLQSLLNVSTG